MTFSCLSVNSHFSDIIIGLPARTEKWMCSEFDFVFDNYEIGSFQVSIFGKAYTPVSP